MSREATGRKWSPEGELETPYRRARKEWDDRMGNAVVQARNWRLATFATLVFVALPSVLGMVYLGAQPKAVPHIVEVAPDGSAAYRGQAGVSWSEYQPGEASVKYHLSRFVHDTRMISADRAVVKRNWLDAYNLVTQSAANTLNEYARQYDPFQRALKERVSVQVLSMVQMSEKSWRRTRSGCTSMSFTGQKYNDKSNDEKLVYVWRCAACCNCTGRVCDCFGGDVCGGGAVRF
ncbi:MAG: conjugal transfer protein TrbF [Prosthecochloris sp.]|nr:conjugal transfer protein TrbF [Prosthecochloris sp.]